MNIIVRREKLTKSSWLDTCTLPVELIPNNEGFEILWDLHPEEHLSVQMYGELVPIPRWQQSYGKSYEFSGIIAKALPIPSELEPFVEYANSIGYQGKFNSILVNWYQDGSHYIGSHSDSLKGLVLNSPIVTITLCVSGENRIFRIRNKNKEMVKDVQTTNGLVLTMGGKFQNELKHEIVKTRKDVGARISITLRQMQIIE